MTIYARGQTAIVKGTFQDPTTGVGLSPTSLKLRVIDPTGTEQTPVTTGFGNPTPGSYTSMVVAALSGQWRYRWEASIGGFVPSACENTFLVATSPFVPD